MTSPSTNIELGFDHPLEWKHALERDKLGRRGYAEAAVQALDGVSAAGGFVLSVDGAWGSGKTSTLAMMEALLRSQKPCPVIVHFNPWLIGDRDALLRNFLSKIAKEVSLSDPAANGKKVAGELKAYSKVFDFIKLVPGAEPWASLVKSVIESAGNAVDSVSDLKTPDIEARKLKVENALRQFDRPIIVFVDDIDRLFPQEAFEMVRIVKAVGDLPNVGYVLAWDPQYVSDALKSANVPRSDTYLDKVVQARLPLPSIGLEARSTLINESMSRLPPEASNSYFPNSEDRLGMLYFSGLRDVLEQPRDYARVFNTVALMEPALRGEIVLSDIIGLAAIMVKAPDVYELMQREPQWFVGPFPGRYGVYKKTEDLMKDGVVPRETAINRSSFPSAIRKLVHRLFPLTAKADDQFSLGRVKEIEGHLAAPTRFLVALQQHVSGADVSFVVARRYLVHPQQRAAIASGLTQDNCMQFLECVGDVAESTAGAGIDDVERLCVDIARLPDTEPFATKSRDRSNFFRLAAEDIAARAISLIVKSVASERAAEVARAIVADSESLSVAMELFAGSYLVDRDDPERLRCGPAARELLAEQLGKNILEATEKNRLLRTSNPGFILWRLVEVSSSVCRSVFFAAKAVDASLDDFVLALCSHSYDSTKGQRYSLPEDRAKVEAYCPISELKEHARIRLAEPSTALPASAAWRAILDEKSYYGVDGSEAR